MSNLFASSRGHAPSSSSSGVLALVPILVGIVALMLGGLAAVLPSGADGARIALLAGGGLMLVVAVVLPLLVRQAIDRSARDLALALHEFAITGSGLQPFLAREDALGEVARAVVAQDQSRPAANADLKTAVQEITLFAHAVSDTVTMVREGHAELAQDVAGLRTAAADIHKLVAEAVGGESRLRKATEALAGAAETNAATARQADQALRRSADIIANSATDFAAKSAERARSHGARLGDTLSAMERHVREGGDRISSAAQGFSAQLQSLLAEQSARTRDLMQSSDFKLRETSMALGDTASSLVRQLDEALKRQQVSAVMLEPLVDAAAGFRGDVDRAVVSLDDRIKALLAREQAMAERIGKLLDVTGEVPRVIAQSFAPVAERLDGAAERLTQHADAIRELDQFVERASDILGASVEALAQSAVSIKGAADAVVDVRQIKGLASEFSETTERAEQVLARVASDRNAHFTEVQGQLALLSEAVAAMDIRLSYESATENQSPSRALTDSVALLGERLDRMGNLMADMAAEQTRLREVSTTGVGVRGSDGDASSLPFFDAEKASFQRVLVGFRLLLRDIGKEAARLREAVGAVTGGGETLRADGALTGVDPARLEALLVALNNVAASLDAKAQAGVGPAEPVETLSLVTFEGATLEGEKASMQRMVAGFRLLLRDIAHEAEHFRVAVAGMHNGSDVRVGSADVDVLDRLQDRITTLGDGLTAAVEALGLRLASPLADTADRIAAGVAETLATLEHRLSEPIAALTASVHESAAVLRQMQALMARQAPGSGDPAPRPASALPALAETTALIARVSDNLEDRLAAIDAALHSMKRDLRNGHVSETVAADLAAAVSAAGDLLRDQTGEFLAIGAALSRELESAAGRLAEPSPPARGRAGSVVGRGRL
jgi:hypothetical protein